MDKKKNKQDDTDRAEQERKILKSMNTAQLKIKINELRQRSNQLIHQLHTLDSSIKSKERIVLKQNYEVQKQIQDKEEILRQLELEFHEKRELHKTELQKFHQQAGKDMEALIQKLQREGATPNAKIKEVREKIEGLKQFVRDEYIYQDTKEKLERKIAESKLKQEEELKKLSRQNEAEKKKLEEENIQEYKRIKAEQLHEAQMKMGLHESRIKLENQSIDQQIRLYTGETLVVQSQIERLRSNIDSLKKKIDNEESARRDLMMEMHKSNNKVKRLKEKQKQFQVHIVKEADRLGSDITSVQEKGSKRAQEISFQIKSCDELLKFKRKELKNLKGLCQLVLDQRVPVEQFFIEVLQEENPRLDLNVTTMTEEDRDRLLRQLFIKINSGAPPQSWRDFQMV